MERRRLYKAIRKDNGQWQEGSYLCQDDTTFCFKEDCEKYPDNTKHYIAFDQSIDWGLPNRHLMTEVFGDTVCEAVDGLVGTNGRQLYEHDVVAVTTTNYYFLNYEILWDKNELCWCGKRVGRERSDGFDRIRLNSTWKYDYIGNTCERRENKDNE